MFRGDVLKEDKGAVEAQPGGGVALAGPEDDGLLKRSFHVCYRSNSAQFIGVPCSTVRPWLRAGSTASRFSMAAFGLPAG